jgi:hypothetical protein
VWAILVFLFLGVALLAFGGVVVALVFFGTQGTETAVAPPPAPPPIPPIELTAPQPTPPRPSSSVRVMFESVPPGAQVWEQEKYLCATPCAIDQPEIAPLPREFVLKLDGHQDEPHRMNDTDTQHIVLKPIAVKPVPTARPRPTGGDDIIQVR